MLCLDNTCTLARKGYYHWIDDIVRAAENHEPLAYWCAAILAGLAVVVTISAGRELNRCWSGAADSEGVNKILSEAGLVLIVLLGLIYELVERLRV